MELKWRGIGTTHQELRMGGAVMGFVKPCFIRANGWEFENYITQRRGEETTDDRAREACEASVKQSLGLDRMREALECLGFAESCIKSGEPWTETCEKMFANARQALKEKE